MKKTWSIGIGCMMFMLMSGIYIYQQDQQDQQEIMMPKETKKDIVTAGTETYQGFLLDNVLHSVRNGDIHYNVYIPENYDGRIPYALYVTLPGYQGLYFQGVGQNIKTEEFGFVAQDYHSNMIIVAPQLEDWQDTSANQTIDLIEYFLANYNIDTSRVYANGYSGGGETMSIVMGKRPELFSAYLHCSSKWDGDAQKLVDSETPVYIIIGENDEYYGSQSSRQTYETFYKLYQEKGLTDEQIDRILILDIKDRDYFESKGVTNQHGGGGQLFVHDPDVMGWLFDQVKDGE